MKAVSREARDLGQAGDPPAALDFPAVYRQHFAYVFRTLRRLGVRPSELNDATQETFTVVLRRLGDYDPQRPIEPWLFGIAFRVAAALRRRRARRIIEVFSRTDEVADDDSLGPESSFADRQARGLVLAGLEALNLDRRAVFVMHDIDGQSVPEIARTLDVPLNTVYSRLRVARAEFFARIQKLRRRRGDNGGEP